MYSFRSSGTGIPTPFKCNIRGDKLLYCSMLLYCKVGITHQDELKKCFLFVCFLLLLLFFFCSSGNIKIISQNHHFGLHTLQTDRRVCGNMQGFFVCLFVFKGTFIMYSLIKLAQTSLRLLN